MADSTETGGFWSGVDSFLNGIGGATSTANSIYDSWQNFGKTEAELKAEKDAQALKLAQETELKRLEYQRQLTATQTATTQTNTSDNMKILYIGAGLLAFVLLTRGK